MYRSIVRPVLFKFDPESAHHLILKLCASPLARVAARTLYSFEDARLSQSLFGLQFANPIGLAAGFDKNCEAAKFLAALGFGHLELGTVTAKPQEGNPRPRIFRIPENEALINRMGFPSHGAEVVRERLLTLRQGRIGAVLGINIGKSKVQPIDTALEDYLFSFRTLSDLGDYYVLNVSSPNTPELRKLQERSRLEELFRGVLEVNKGKKPLLVKISPDLTYAELDQILECVVSFSISGVIATNTTLSREGLVSVVDQAGGLSGKPLQQKSLELVRHLSAKTKGAIPIIGVGGVSTAEAAYAMLKAGASLIQLYTGLIYEGPAVVKQLKTGLLTLMDRDGVGNIREIIGIERS